MCISFQLIFVSSVPKNNIYSFNFFNNTFLIFISYFIYLFILLYIVSQSNSNLLIMKACFIICKNLCVSLLSRNRVIALESIYLKCLFSIKICGIMCMIMVLKYHKKIKINYLIQLN